jgi:hypothetical protein
MILENALNKVESLYGNGDFVDVNFGVKTSDGTISPQRGRREKW